MTSTPSTILRLELMGQGDQPGTWGNTTNSNIGSLLEGAIAGVANVSVSSAAQAFIALDYAPDEARMAIIKLSTTGAVTTAFAVYAPPVSKIYVVQNNSAYAATVYNSTVLGNTVAAGVGVVVGAGESAVVFSDGASFYGLSLATGVVPVIRGGTGANNAVDARTNLGLTIGADVAAITSPAFAGTPTAPTAIVGTNDTQLATTAFVNAQVADYAPSKTGTGASGTWGINISGSSATAGSATSAATATTAGKFTTTTGTAPVFAARAWANILGWGGATIQGAGNVSSVSYNGPGDYTINFSTPMPNANYAVVGTANNYNYGQSLTVAVKYGDGSIYGATSPTLKTTSAVRIVVGYGNSTAYTDAPELNVMIIC
jgi:hypothetical protein